MALIRTWKELIFAVAFVAKVVYSAEDTTEVSEEAEAKDQRRPIWNIGHMANDIAQVDKFLDRGANSVEFDITFDPEGIAKVTYHGIPCDCFRLCYDTEDISTFIDHLRQLTTPGDPRFREQLVLLFFDLKLNKLSQTALFRGGQDIATKLLDNYFKGTQDARAYILISFPSVKQVAFVRGFRSIFEEKNATEYYAKIAYDFSDNEDLGKIEATVEAEGLMDSNIWIGDGITNCFPRGIGRLLKALDIRDRTEKSFINKVYWWTVDRMSTMKRTLSLGVDGMITNQPERLIRVLNDEELSPHVRLATIDDCPWDNYPPAMGRMMSAKGNATEVLFNIQNPKIDYL